MKTPIDDAVLIWVYVPEAEQLSMEQARLVALERDALAAETLRGDVLSLEPDGGRAPGYTKKTQEFTPSREPMITAEERATLAELGY